MRVPKQRFMCLSQNKSINTIFQAITDKISCKRYKNTVYILMDITSCLPWLEKYICI